MCGKTRRHFDHVDDFPFVAVHVLYRRAFGSWTSSKIRIAHRPRLNVSACPIMWRINADSDRPCLFKVPFPVGRNVVGLDIVVFPTRGDELIDIVYERRWTAVARRVQYWLHPCRLQRRTSLCPCPRYRPCCSRSRGNICTGTIIHVGPAQSKSKENKKSMMQHGSELKLPFSQTENDRLDRYGLHLPWPADEEPRRASSVRRECRWNL